MGAREFLLISRVGRGSLHHGWISDSVSRNYDVFLSTYHEDLTLTSDNTVVSEYRPGPKIEGYAGILSDYRTLIKKYKYIALWDDDIEASPTDICRLFDIGSREKLKIFQPALTSDSYFSYASLLRQEAFELRYFNFIEMMCPCFRTDVLFALEDLFKKGYESGIDLVWCNLVFEKDTDFAVIDAVSVRHTRPVGEKKAANGFTNGRVYEDDISKALAEFNIPWLSSVPYAGKLPSGQLVRSRLPLLYNAIRAFSGIPLNMVDAAKLRKLLVHCKHLVTRTPLNISLSVI